MLVCDYISGATGSYSFGAHTGIGTANYFVWFGRKQNSSKTLLVSGLVRIGQSQVLI
jgi:hypothetical protein